MLYIDEILIYICTYYNNYYVLSILYYYVHFMMQTKINISKIITFSFFYEHYTMTSILSTQHLSKTPVIFRMARIFQKKYKIIF